MKAIKNLAGTAPSPSGEGRGGIIALIPSYGNREYLADMEAWLKTSGEVDDVIVLKQDNPIGASNARKQLVTQAFEKYGTDAIYLMLDDDCIFTEQSKIRNAAKHFTELDGIGIISIPVSLPPSPSGEGWGGARGGHDHYETVKSYHCFLISGKVLATSSPLLKDEGQGEVINYSDDEYCDEIDISLKAWLAGFKNIITYRCVIWHHATNSRTLENPGAYFKGIINGDLQFKSSFVSNYSKQFKFSTYKLFDVEIPQFFSIVPRRETRLLHDKNRIELLK